MPGYSGFKKKKSTLGSTLMLVAALHVVAAGGLVWLASTSVGREMLAVYKIKILSVPPPATEPPKAVEAKAVTKEAAPAAEKAAPAEKASPPPAPEPTPPPEAEAEAPPPEEAAPVSVAESAPVESAGSGPMTEEPAGGGSPVVADLPRGEMPSGAIRLPGSGNPFAGPGAGGVGRKFSGYADLVTSEIQRRYKQPAELQRDIRLAVQFQLLLDEEGKLLHFKILNSSGDERFDQSALQALAEVKQLRPPPPGMSKTIIVKFYPPS